jgi:hypothetical protein
LAKEAAIHHSWHPAVKDMWGRWMNEDERRVLTIYQISGRWANEG